MSKVVKGIGRAVSKVVKGVVNVVKKVAKSKLGKVLIGAALVYFGGAALMGGMAAPAGSGISGFLSGAGSGLSSAATGISNAFTALTQGSLSGVKTALSEGFMGTGSAAFTGSTPTGLATVAADAAPLAVQTAAPTAGAFTGQTITGLPTVAADAANVLNAGSGGSGLLAKAMSSPYTAPALISGGTQLIGGVMQGYGAQKQQERQEQLAEDQKKAYNTNVGTRLYA
jgi:hypothetical protein